MGGASERLPVTGDPFADRLAEQGKPKKVVLVAVMRKLLTLLNAMLRDNLTWNQLECVKNA